MLIDVERYTERELLALSNTIGAVFLLDQTADRQQLHDRLAKLMDTVRSMPEELKSQFLNWLAHMVARQLPDPGKAIDDLINQFNQEGEVTMGLQQNLEAIRNSGVEEGLKLGIAKGMEEGLEQGLEQGLAQGLEQAALRMLRLGLSLPVIGEATGFSDDKLQKLRERMK